MLTLTPPDAGWMSQAACAGDWGVMEGLSDDDVWDAKATCRRCPVRRRCEGWVLSLPPSQDVNGIAAAMTPEERDKARRRARRSRPPVPEATKECRRCLEEQAVSKFYVRPARTDGRDSYCRTCCAELARERAAEKRAAS
jgi:hypothetical protein